LRPEARVGLARDGRVAREGLLYAMTHLRAEEGWALLVEFSDGPATGGRCPRGPVPLGGRARLADVEPVSAVGWPACPAAFPGGRVLVYVVTAALWPGGWRPPLPAGARLVAAAVPPPLPVPTGSPRAAGRENGRFLDTVMLRWAVPPGAVYLVQFPGDPQAAARQARDWAGRLHGRALGPGLDAAVIAGQVVGRDGEPGTDRTSTAGFGVVLTGVWGGSDEFTTDGRSARDVVH
jgi:hypothetical protein